MNGPPIYDRIGTAYAASRTADRRIVAQLEELLSLRGGSTIADIGAGTGNYANALADCGYRIHAIEPSTRMRAQAKPHDRVEWHSGTAETVPLADRSVDGVVVALALHHFDSASRAFAEMQRIGAGGPVVIFTMDPRESGPLWFSEYFPEIWQRNFETFPPYSEIIASMAAFADEPPCAAPFPLPADLEDQFMFAGWNRPELYLDPTFRANTSGFAQAAQNAVERNLQRLRRDLDSGEWDRRFGDLRHAPSFDAGFRFVSCRASK